MDFLPSLRDTLRVFPHSFGLDISDHGLKFAYIENASRAYRLKIFGERLFGKGIVENGKIVNPDALVKELRLAMKEKNAGGLPSYVISALPEEENFVRVIQVPKMNAKELREAIKWETEANIPLSIDQVYYDYEIIPPLPSSRPGHLDVLVAASPRTWLDAYTHAIEGAGLYPVVFEPESLALVRSLVAKKSEDEATLLVDIGAVRTRFVIYAAKSVRFTSFGTFSTTSVLQSVQRDLKADEKEANKLVFDVGLSARENETNVRDMLISAIGELKEQIEKYLVFYNTHSEHSHGQNREISSIILAGGGGLIPGLVEHLAGTIKITVELGNPWVNILHFPLHELPPMPYRESLRFSSVLGLALRGAQPVQNMDLSASV